MCLDIKVNIIALVRVLWRSRPTDECIVKGLFYWQHRLGGLTVADITLEDWDSGSCSVHEDEGLSSPSLVLKAWKIPEPLVFVPYWKAKEDGFWSSSLVVAAATVQIHLPTRCKGKQLKIKTFPPQTSFYLGFHWKKDAAHFGEDSSRKYPYRHTQRHASWLNSDPGKLMNKDNYQKCVLYPMPTSSIYCFGGTCSEMSSKSGVHGSGRWLNQ